MREMLRHNLAEAYADLPPAFLLGAYYFFVQRAAEDISLRPFRARWDGPQEECPEYQLGFAVGKAQALAGYEIPSRGDPVIDRAHFSIAVGRLVRPWGECSSSMPFLSWLQDVTQVTRAVDMGAIAGDYRQPFDVSYVYRFFFHVPALDATLQTVDAIEVEMCDPGGAPLDEPELERKGRGVASLASVRRTHARVTVPFWEGNLPRGSYLGP